jgi:cytochrome c
MKKLSLIALVIFAISCKKESDQSFGKPENATPETTTPSSVATDPTTPVDLGKVIFEGKGTCATCHKLDSKLIGPSVQDIAKIYKEKNADIVVFLKGEGKPIVDPSQFEVMKANFALTKTFSDEELKGLEAYIYSNSK